MVDLNRLSRTPLDSERPKLSAGLCRGVLSHSGARWRGGAPPPQVTSRLVKKDVRGELRAAFFNVSNSS